MEKLDNSLRDNNSLRAKVFKEIEKSILDGVFSPGDNLIEQKLSNELGVSRTPVREALRQLELEGLVKTVPNKGAVVIGISQKDIEDIYTIRVYIEGLAARWSASCITDDELDILREIVELQEFYVSRSDFIQVWHLDTKFHAVLYETCRSRTLKHSLTNFHHYVQKAREISVKTSGRAVNSVLEHRRIYEALAAHDSDNAEKLVAEHISNAKANLLENI